MPIQRLTEGFLKRLPNRSEKDTWYRDTRLDAPLDYLRPRAFPFNGKVQKFIDDHERVFVVEQNRDAQLCSLLMAELDIPKSKLIPVLHYDGFPLSNKFVLEFLYEATRKESAA